MDEPVGGLILQQKWEDLTEYLFSCVLRDMAKSERFTLGADIRSLVWEVQAIPQKRHEPIAEKLSEIGRIVGGLKKTRQQGAVRSCEGASRRQLE